MKVGRNLGRSPPAIECHGFAAVDEVLECLALLLDLAPSAPALEALQTREFGRSKPYWQELLSDLKCRPHPVHHRVLRHVRLLLQFLLPKFITTPFLVPPVDDTTDTFAVIRLHLVHLELSLDLSSPGKQSKTLSLSSSCAADCLWEQHRPRWLAALSAAASEHSLSALLLSLEAFVLHAVERARGFMPLWVPRLRVLWRRSLAQYEAQHLHSVRQRLHHCYGLEQDATGLLSQQPGQGL